RKRIATGNGMEDHAGGTVEVSPEQAVGAVVGPEDLVVQQAEGDPPLVGAGRSDRAAQRNRLQVGPAEIHALELAGSAVGPEDASGMSKRRQIQQNPSKLTADHGLAYLITRGFRRDSKPGDKPKAESRSARWVCKRKTLSSARCIRD